MLVGSLYASVEYLYEYTQLVRHSRIGQYGVSSYSTDIARVRISIVCLLPLLLSSFTLHVRQSVGLSSSLPLHAMKRAVFLQLL